VSTPCYELPEGCKLIPEFPFYCAHPDGIVFSCRTRGGKFTNWTAMTPRWDHAGTPQARLGINLWKDGKKYPRALHRLILETFSGPCPTGLEACHNDGIAAHCGVGNLRWDTHQSNMDDRRRHGVHYRGERNPAVRLTESQVLEIRRLHTSGTLQKDLAPHYGVSKQCIQAVCSRSTWNHLQ
jgi:hypothetical protein